MPEPKSDKEKILHRWKRSFISLYYSVKNLEERLKKFTLKVHLRVH